MAGPVDGYGPDEFDDIHWDLLAGGIVAVVAGGGLFYLSRIAGGSGAKWLAIAGAILIVAAIIGCAVSNFYRRYAFFVWWRRGVVIVPAMILLLLMNSFTAMLTVLRSGGLGVGNQVGGWGHPRVSDVPTWSIKKDLPELDVAVDEDGHVYEWSTFRGKWRYRADSLSGVPARRLRIKRTIFGPVEELPDRTTIPRVEF